MTTKQNEATLMMNESRAVLWDVDGTLIDSEELHWLSWSETMRSEGIDLTRAQFAATFGRRNDAVLREYYGERDLGAEEVARISDYKEARYRELLREQGIETLPGVRRWLEQLRARGWRQAIASSAPPANIEAIVVALKLESYFDAIASAEEVEHGKPYPDIFLHAAAKLGIAPARCVVVEDAPAGVESARRAGMRCVGVLTTHQSLDADLIARTLD